MTLESTDNQNRYVGNGSTTTFPFTFRVWKKDEVAVFVGNGTTEREVSSTCTIELTASGGSVTFRTAPPAGQAIVIRRNMPYIQEDDYRNGTRFDSEEVEDRFDQDCAERQDLKLEIGRCIKLPITSAMSADDFVELLLQAIEALREAGDVSGGSLVKADGTTEYRTLSDRLADNVSPEDFGAKGDGETDDTAAFEALEASFTDRRVNLHSKTFKVHTPFCKNYYYNGFWTYDVDYAGNANPGTKPAYNDNVVMEYGSVHSGGSGTTGRNYCILNDNETEDLWQTNLKNVVAIGENTLTKSIKEHSSYLSDYIAIGRGVMSEYDMTENPGHNIGIGQWAMHELTTGDRNIAIGSLALQFARKTYKTIAIGRDCASGTVDGGQNVFIGYQCFGGFVQDPGGRELELEVSNEPFRCTVIGSHCVNCPSGSPRRVTAMGAFTATRVRSISNSTLVGADSANNVGYNKSPNQKSFVDYSKYAVFPEDGIASFSIDGSLGTITPNDPALVSSVSVGMLAYISLPGIGSNSFEVTQKNSSNFVVDLKSSSYSGRSGSNADIVSLSEQPKVCTYTVSNGKAVLTPVDTGVPSTAVVGNLAYADIPGIGVNYLTVYSKTATTITLALTGSAIDGTSGTCSLLGLETSTQYDYSQYTINRTSILGDHQFFRADHLFGVTALGSQISGEADFIGSFERCDFLGYQSANHVGSGYRAVVVGSRACYSTEALEDCIVIGNQANYDADSVVNSVCIGFQSGVQSGTDYNNVLLGDSCGKVLVGRDRVEEDVTQGPRRNTAVGFRAMTAMTDGTTSSNSLYNTTCLGAYSAASGNNQVQLGDSSTTVYCYGSVQDRSDARDKADVRDTVLGLDFIKQLRPVDFRWDYRDSYIDRAEDGSISLHEKDGSRKRTRYHHGLIAQEVKAILDASGIDFGGYQDHKINGGSDVLTLGYEEFVAPIIKSIQELNARLEALEGA